MKIVTGKWTERELDRLIVEAAKIGDVGGRIDFLSEKFLGTAYREFTLIGEIETPEVLVADLSGVDCFTFIDYVEAMRMSGSFDGFIGNLQKVRYKSGRVSFQDRNHFFTDWIESNRETVADVTGRVGGPATAVAIKMLNQKEDGACWLPGIRSLRRELRYMPSSALGTALEKLETGDYAGIYSEKPGLDVSHVGIVIKGKGEVFLRHASSKHGKVVDEDLGNYIANRPGLIVFRPK